MTAEAPEAFVREYAGRRVYITMRSLEKTGCPAAVTMKGEGGGGRH